MEDKISEAVHFFLSAAALWLLATVFWRDLSIDIHKNELFRLRDRLFYVGLQGRISFENPAYRILRLVINGYLRSAPLACAADIFAYAFTMPFRKPRDLRSHIFDRHLNVLEKSVVDELNEIYSDVHFEVGLQVVRRNPLMFPIVVGAILLIRLRAIPSPPQFIDALDGRAEEAELHGIPPRASERPRASAPA